MASFSKGTSFNDGVTGDVTAAKLHALVDAATPVPGFITDRTAETSIATDDLVLISDTSESGALNKITVENLFKAPLTGDINSTSGTITAATIPTLTAGTTTGTAATFTSGTISTLNSTTGTISTLNSTTGTISTLNSTTGTISTLNSTTGTISTGVIPTLTAGTTTSTAATITTGTITTGVIPTLTSTTLITSGTGTAAAPAIVPTGDTNTGIFFPAADTIAFSEGGSERLRIDSDGDVGIGTSSIQAKFHVNSGTSDEITRFDGGSASFPYISFYASGARNFYLQSASSTSILMNFEQNKNVSFGVNGSTRFVIQSDGIVDINSVYSNLISGRTMICSSIGLIGATSSSIKYKKDVENIYSSIVENAITNLRPVWYRSKKPNGDDKETWSHIGLIAEEVAQVEPRIVSFRTMNAEYDKDGNKIVTYLDNPIPEDVDYSRLSVILLAEAQSQRQKIANLESRIAALEAA